MEPRGRSACLLPRDPASPAAPANPARPIRTELRRLLFAFFAFASLTAASARAQLTIEIVGGAGTEVPIAIVPFENENNWPLGGVTGIVGADLQRSGLFKLVNDSGIVPR